MEEGISKKCRPAALMARPDHLPAVLLITLFHHILTYMLSSQSTQLNWLFLVALLALLLTGVVFPQSRAELNHYKAANEQLGEPVPGEHRVVFMGNSITESWPKLTPDFFLRKAYICRGISGQTTSQMLLRFRQDVIDLKPDLVIILAGTNDIAENNGPISLPDILDNIRSMTRLARANNIKVILASILPVATYPWRPELHPAEKVVALNKLIKQYATEEDIIYLDYHTSMVDRKGGLTSEFTNDGVHPNAAGYRHMNPITTENITTALRILKN